MLNGKLPAPSNPTKREAIEQEFAFFGIPIKLEPIIPPASSSPRPPTPSSLLMIPQPITFVETNTSATLYHFRDSFQAWLPGKRFELLYRASQYVTLPLQSIKRNTSKEKKITLTYAMIQKWIWSCRLPQAL